MSDMDIAAKAIAEKLNPATDHQEPQEQVVTDETDAVEAEAEEQEVDASEEVEAVEQEGAVESQGTIEPPKFLSDQERAAFSGAPPEIQQWIIQRHNDQESAFTKKSQEIAEARKTAETEKAALDQRRQELEQAFAAIPQEKPPHSDEQLAELKASDEVSWTVAMTENAAFERKQEALKAEQAKLHKERLDAFATEQAKAIQEAAQKLPELIPEWKDEAVATKEKAEVAQYLSSLGYSDDMISGLSDPVAIAVTNKARKWDALQASKVVKLGKVKAAPKMGAPGSPEGKVTNDALKKAQEKAKKTGKVDDVGAALAVRFANRT